jgi:hypothetical protein
VCVCVCVWGVFFFFFKAFNKVLKHFHMVREIVCPKLSRVLHCMLNNSDVTVSSALLTGSERYMA